MNAPEKPQLLEGPGIGLLPIGKFFTPEYFALEKERVFKKSWIRVGYEAQIPNVGDYFVREMQACDTSVIVVRGRDERIRAFHNSCAHRSNRVAYEESGNTKAFVCRFHSWSFGLDGSLRALPEAHLFPGLKKEDFGLTEVACEMWEGHIFVNVDPKPAQTLREYLGEELYTGFNGFFKKYKRVMKCTVMMEANWKVCIDAFIETYHFSTVHIRTMGDVILSEESPNGRVEAFREYGKHRVVSATSNNIKHAPTFAEMLVINHIGGGATLAGDRANQMGFPPQVNPNRVADWITEIAILFPITNMQPFSGFYATQMYWPVSHDRTLWEFEVYMDAPQTAADDVALEYNRSVTRDAVREDLQNLAMIQTNLNSGAQHHHVLGEMEVMVAAGYKTLAKEVGRGL